MNMLHIVEPYATYGYPNLKSVKELLYKRGYGKLNKQRTSLIDNSIIEQLSANIIYYIEITPLVSRIPSAREAKLKRQALYAKAHYRSEPRALTSALQSLMKSLNSVCKDGQEQCR
ncbi:hypothetical protein JHK87_055370 [Glycine soja]|nr:hypothetical protein JHK87_055370 [Glycine soja]